MILNKDLMVKHKITTKNEKSAACKIGSEFRSDNLTIVMIMIKSEWLAVLVI